MKTKWLASQNKVASIGEKPWRALGESNSSFQVENLTSYQRFQSLTDIKWQAISRYIPLFHADWLAFFTPFYRVGGAYHPLVSNPERTNEMTLEIGELNPEIQFRDFRLEDSVNLWRWLNDAVVAAGGRVYRGTDIHDCLGGGADVDIELRGGMFAIQIRPLKHIPSPAPEVFSAIKEPVQAEEPSHPGGVLGNG